MSEDALFDASPYQAPTTDLSGMGQDAARTVRRQALLDAGIHPATRLPLRAEGGTCAGCAHLIVKDGPSLGVGSGRWWKCTQTLKDGKGPDMRKSWPACTAFTPPTTTEGGA